LLLEAADFVRTIQKRTGQMIGSPEEVAFRQGFIDAEQLLCLAHREGKSSYGEYLASVAAGDG
jgi:glucose-1-phosphate thymidylyltransferase